ncbi:MAG: phosphopyruvate hydratase, partial [Candidatus Hydrothermarchaeota archaeon]|nr:phosphopyruvate hydratase [Candidatus Hydrothermarchaeota archaeon]
MDVVTPSGFGRCAAPSGASTGKFEVQSYPEGGVDEAVRKVQETVAPEIVGMNAEEQEAIDSVLKDVDGTDNFSNIGGNTAVAVSLAVAKAAASSRGISLFRYLGGNSDALPYPLGNIIGGGAHASNATDIQEFLVIPTGASDIRQALWTNSEVHRRVKDELSARGNTNSLGKGDEGAWAPSIGDEKALDVLARVTAEVGDELGIETRLGVDVASSEMWDPDRKRYVYQREGVERTREE